MFDWKRRLHNRLCALLLGLRKFFCEQHRLRYRLGDLDGIAEPSMFYCIFREIMMLRDNLK